MPKPSRIFSCLLTICISINLLAQPPQISVVTDIGLQRSLKKDQKFWAFGHTLQFQYHITYKDALYVWLSYYTNGKFSNFLTATAKDPSTNPQQVDYLNHARMGFKHFSLGWKKYLINQYDIESGWNLYVYGGFGVLFGKVINELSATIDTAVYNMPVLGGEAAFKRLTVDLGLGSEFPIGADFFIFTEGRLWVPASDYPSKYVFVNNNAPLVGMFNLGVRVLF